MKPGYLALVLVLTSAYLIFELGFNARLLDVVGGQASPQDIDAIEKWGRVISGIALTLAIWGTYLFPAASEDAWMRTFQLPLAVGIAVCSLSGAWFGERYIVDHVVNSSSGEIRRTAMQLRVVSVAMLNGKLPMHSIDLGSPDARSPAVKAFLAIFPGFIFSYPEIGETLHQLVMAPEMATALKGTATLTMPPETIWKQVFLPAFSKVRSQFDEVYVVGSGEYNNKIADIPTYQVNKWAEYLSLLQQNGLSLKTAPNYRAEIISALRNRNLNIPSNWNPGDRATFYTAIAERVQQEAGSQFADQSERRLGAAIAPNLDWASFCQQPPIQARLRFDLGLPGNVPISCAMDFSTFARLTYPALPSGYGLRTLTSAVDGAVHDFEDNGPLAESGKLAVTGLIVPPIALGFSLLGAMVHVFKVTKYAVTLMLGTDAGFVAALGLSGYLAFIPTQRPNAVTTSAGYEKLENSKLEDKRFGQLETVAFRWVIQAQPVYYPINELIRQQMLSGYSFDRFPNIDAKTDGSG